MKHRLFAFAGLFVFLLCGAVSAQPASKGFALGPAWEKGLTEEQKMKVPFPPHHVIGNIYYVGTRAIGIFLVTTPAGNILINAGYDYQVPMIHQSVEKLGFKWADTKILLTTHAHQDMSGGAAQIVKETGAKFEVMDADVSAVESGGVKSVNAGDARWPAAKVDKVLHDGDKVTLDGTVLTAILTPGHTKGTTSWAMTAKEGGKSYSVILIGGIDAHDNYRFFNYPYYPNNAEDFRTTFRVLKALHPDVYIGSRPEYYGMEAKYAKMKPGGPNVFIDPAGYQAYIADREKLFLAILAKQTADQKAAPSH